MGRVEAQREADAELADAVEAERTKGPIPPWLEATLSIAGGLGVAGATGLAGKALAKGKGLFSKAKLEAPKPKSALDKVDIDKVPDELPGALTKKAADIDPDPTLGPGSAFPRPLAMPGGRAGQARQPHPGDKTDFQEMDDVLNPAPGPMAATGNPGTSLANIANSHQRNAIFGKSLGPIRPSPRDNPNPSTPNAQIQGVDIEQEIAEAIGAPSRSATQNATRQLSNQKMAELIASGKQARQGLPKADIEGVEIELPEDRGAFPMTDPNTLASLLRRFQQ
jgi:hypothetical protein